MNRTEQIMREHMDAQGNSSLPGPEHAEWQERVNREAAQLRSALRMIERAPGCPAIGLPGTAERSCPPGIWCASLPLCRRRRAEGK